MTRHDVPADRLSGVQALANAKSHCALDPRAARIETWEAWGSAMQIGSALFRAATSPEPTVECTISGKPRAIHATRGSGS
ncbi:hypothetical protein ACQEWB_35875 [Streptomyces sp. CA-249302]|uniref:hypothetical protein n=1 Tax=Streptomyces sp. CA-249302 TaxID=3240058 RepID=UPI003D8F478A